MKTKLLSVLVFFIFNFIFSQSVPGFRITKSAETTLSLAEGLTDAKDDFKLPIFEEIEIKIYLEKKSKLEEEIKKSQKELEDKPFIFFKKVDNPSTLIDESKDDPNTDIDESLIIDDPKTPIDESKRLMTPEEYRKAFQPINEMMDQYKTTITKINELSKIIEKKKEEAINISKIEEKNRKIEEAKSNLIKNGAFGFNAYESKAFYDIIYSGKTTSWNTINNAGVVFGGNSGAIYTEIVAGNFEVVRVSFGTLLANSNDQDETKMKEEEAYQRLMTYGGNTVLTVEYPLFWEHNSENTFNAIGRLTYKTTGDFKALGTSTESSAVSNSLGLSMYLDASIVEDDFRLFLNLNINGITGNKEYKDNLGLNDYSLFHGQLALGANLFENLRISAIFTLFSSDATLRNAKPLYGTQVIKPM
jgi:hypothetical protein